MYGCGGKEHIARSISARQVWRKDPAEVGVWVVATGHVWKSQKVERKHSTEKERGCQRKLHLQQVTMRACQWPRLIQPYEQEQGSSESGLVGMDSTPNNRVMPTWRDASRVLPSPIDQYWLAREFIGLPPHGAAVTAVPAGASPTTSVAIWKQTENLAAVCIDTAAALVYGATTVSANVWLAAAAPFLAVHSVSTSGIPVSAAAAAVARAKTDIAIIVDM
jgi:hypothetical protein